MTSARPALRIEGLSKTFSGQQALNSVSLEVASGEVHALLGQNGSGKSTLIKCLAGVYRPEAGGVVEVDGRALPSTYPPSEARRFGLAFVHQDLGLLPEMTVAENLALGAGFDRVGPWINWRSQHRIAQRTLDEFGLLISPRSTVGELPVTARTLLAIARAFQPVGEGAPLQCLILDEPTAALPDEDAHQLFSSIERVKKAGVGIVYVTHRLEEVFRLADRATILRDGRRVDTLQISGLTHDSLISTIVGDSRGAESDPSTRSSQSAAPGAVVLEAKGLSGTQVRDANVVVREREILGIAGLAGSGRSELARLLFGVQRGSSGVRHVGGAAVPPGSVKASMAAGIAMVPEDRRREGAVLTMSVAENMTLTNPPTRYGMLSISREKRMVRKAVSDLDIRPPDPARTVGTMSGGNQQKVILAKWLSRTPRVLILDEPVQGVDVGAKRDIFRLLRSASASGMGLIVIDSDFDNIAELCTRVIVLQHGVVVEELAGRDVTAARISRATFGAADPVSQELIARPAGGDPDDN